MEVGTLHSKFAEVNGTKKNRCVTGAQNAFQTAKEPSKEQTLLGSQTLYMGIFSNDFAAVDVREELCYHSRPKEANSRGMEKPRVTQSGRSIRNNRV